MLYLILGMSAAGVLAWFLVTRCIPRRFPHEIADPQARTELQEAQAEITQLDIANHGLQLRIDELTEQLQKATFERDEAIQSAEHWQERHNTVEGIRQQLAASLSGRSNGHQITMGNGDAKIVHGSVVSDPDSDCRRNV